MPLLDHERKGVGERGRGGGRERSTSYDSPYYRCQYSRVVLLVQLVPFLHGPRGLPLPVDLRTPANIHCKSLHFNFHLASSRQRYYRLAMYLDRKDVMSPIDSKTLCIVFFVEI